MIPVHPVPGPEPHTMRWRMPAGTLPTRGPATVVPGRFGELVSEGVVAHVVVGRDHLDVTLADGHDWRTDGPGLRTALLAALETPHAWRTAAGDPAPAGQDTSSAEVTGADAVLRRAALGLLSGEVGELARSHGGAIDLDSVADGVVSVRMRGACSGCPAAGLTLHARLEHDLREACPDELVEVRATEAEPSRSPGKTFLGLIGRRHPA